MRFVDASNNLNSFGMLMPNRQFTAIDNYRFGFNGKEKDNDLKGTGNSLDFGARIYDPRLGSWLSVDPLQKKYPDLSPYCFTGNNPVLFKDFDGKDYGIEIVGNTIIIHATYYTDLKAKTIEYTKAALNYINSFSNKYQFTDQKSGQVYDIKFDLQLSVPCSDGYDKAVANDRANYVETLDEYPISRYSIFSFPEHYVGGYTAEGGDDIMVADADFGKTSKNWKSSINDPYLANYTTAIEEILHSLGVSHPAMGDKKAETEIVINEKVISGMLRYASKRNNQGIRIKVDDAVSYSQSDMPGISKKDEPKVSFSSGNNMKGSVKKAKPKT